MSSAHAIADSTWSLALTTRRSVLDLLETVPAGSASEGDPLKPLRSIGSLCNDFRSVAIKLALHDIVYATENQIEDVIWNLHRSVIVVYRLTMQHYGRESRSSQIRAANRQFSEFLNNARKFYKIHVSKLSAMYDLVKIRIAAKGLGIPMVSDACSSTSSNECKGLALRSCYFTLLHLGDLVRYQLFANDSTTEEFITRCEKALTCYEIACILEPKFGLPLNQIGLVNLHKNSHLDVVFNFCKALVTKEPCLLARSNLEREFQTLRIAGWLGGDDILCSMFIKLHAFYFNREPFRGQAELEHEVILGLESACEVDGYSNLLKMVLINMSVHDIASSDFAKDRTEAAFNHMYCVLQLNALFLDTICKVLNRKISEIRPPDPGITPDNLVAQLQPTLSTLLPSLRLYSVWLLTHHEQVFAAFGGSDRAVLDSRINFLRTLSQLWQVKDPEIWPPHLTAPYEDMEVFAMRVFNDEQMPGACRSLIMRGASDSTQLIQPTDDNYARISDILHCGGNVVQRNASLSVYQRALCQGFFELQFTPLNHQSSNAGGHHMAHAQMINPPVFAVT